MMCLKVTLQNEWSRRGLHGRDCFLKGNLGHPNTETRMKAHSALWLSVCHTFLDPLCCAWCKCQEAKREYNIVNGQLRTHRYKVAVPDVSPSSWRSLTALSCLGSLFASSPAELSNQTLVYTRTTEQASSIHISVFPLYTIFESY